MPESTDLRWFTPSEHGDQAPDALLTNRTMNRIDLTLLTLVATCTTWNILGVLEIRSDSTLGAAKKFFLRPSTVSLWSVVTITVLWLIARFVLTRETRFVLVWEGLVLGIAALMPMITMEMAGMDVFSPGSDFRLTAYDCTGAPPPPGTSPNLADCGGFALDDGSIRLFSEYPEESDVNDGRNPDYADLNTATWQGLPGGGYAIYLLVNAPGASCSVAQPNVVAIDADTEISCFGSGATVVRVQHSDGLENLRLALYPESEPGD